MAVTKCLPLMKMESGISSTTLQVSSVISSSSNLWQSTILYHFNSRLYLTILTICSSAPRSNSISSLEL